MLKYILGLMIFVSISAYGQETQSTEKAFKAPVIAVIQYAKIQRSSKAWKGFSEQFEKVKNKYHEDIKKRQDELQKRQAELQKQSSVLSPERFAVEEKKFREDVVALQRDTDKRKRSLDKVFNEALRNFEINIGKIVAQVANERKVDIVLNKGGNDSTLFFWTEGISITDEVLKRFDKEHPENAIKIDEKAVE